LLQRTRFTRQQTARREQEKEREGKISKQEAEEEEPEQFNKHKAGGRGREKKDISSVEQFRLLSKSLTHEFLHTIIVTLLCVIKPLPPSVFIEQNRN
jgi:hypothetical protein